MMGFMLDSTLIAPNSFGKERAINVSTIWSIGLRCADRNPREG
jgi:hypothetical protein